MLYREIIALCSQIHTKCINTLCGQNLELLSLKLAVYVVTTGPKRVKFFCLLLHLVTILLPERNLHSKLVYYSSTHAY